MVIELRIRDFAVIDDLTLELGPGLNVLTGETGAGKSIIVDALALLLGERASTEDVRAGAERALIEAVFDIDGVPGLRDQLDDMGLPSEDGLLILRREVQREGRNRAWVNGSPATAGTVGALGARLVDLHGQHDHQTLLRRTAQRDILDAFAGAREQAAAVAAAWTAWREARETLEARRTRLEELARESDFLRHQLDEIQTAQIDPDEERELDAEAERLAHSQELAREIARVHEELYEGEESVSDHLAGLLRTLEREGRLDARLDPIREMVEGALEMVQEAGRRAGDYATDVEHDPGRLQEIELRRELLFRLKRKYGPDLADVLETGRSLEEQVRELDEADADLSKLDQEVTRAEKELEEEARTLTTLRTDAAAELGDRVERLLPGLGMKDGVMDIALLPEEEVGRTGAESVEFRVSLNAGFEPRGLARVASGGELSRVMLALKTVLAEVDEVPTLIFDEIDAGVGGAVAHGVAETLARVADHHQVFVITHLPQLASRAAAHLLVEKTTSDGIAATRVARLEAQERISEIARMLGGDAESSASLEHARTLLEGV
ncbi:MAG TPA: DNA repair protein RecN [Longimicrobiales bacterium]|nr:DNA repair protein RecN [Longimicrobiales bacterium]